MEQVINISESKSIPFFSIIIPTKDRPQHLKKCLDSILDQSFENYEVILVNDGEEFGNTFEQFHKSSTNLIVMHSDKKGVSAARNAGMSEAKGLYLIFLDDDECFDQDHLLQLNRFYNEEQNRNTICKTGTLLIKEDGTKFKEGNFTSNRELLPQMWSYGASMSDYCFPANTLEKIKFETRYFLIEDFIFLNKVLSLNHSLFLAKYTVLIDDHEKRISYVKFENPGKSFFGEISAVEGAINYLNTNSKIQAVPSTTIIKKLAACTYVYFKKAIMKVELTSAIKILSKGTLAIARFAFNRIRKK